MLPILIPAGGYKMGTKDKWFYRLPTWIRLGVISLVWLLLLFIQFLVFGIKFGNSILSKPMANYRIFCIEIILSAYWLFFIIWQLNVLMKYLVQKQSLLITNFRAHCSVYIIIMLLSFIQIIITIICSISIKVASLVSQYPWYIRVLLVNPVVLSAGWISIYASLLALLYDCLTDP
jgi:hypothetical protein